MNEHRTYWNMLGAAVALAALLLTMGKIVVDMTEKTARVGAAADMLLVQVRGIDMRVQELQTQVARIESTTGQAEANKKVMDKMALAIERVQIRLATIARDNARYPRVTPSPVPFPPPSSASPQRTTPTAPSGKPAR